MVKKYCRKFQPPEQGAQMYADRRQTDLRWPTPEYNADTFG